LSEEDSESNQDKEKSESEYESEYDSEEPKQNVLGVINELRSPLPVQEEIDIWKILRAKLILWGFIMKICQDEDEFAEWFGDEKWNRYRSSAIRQNTKW
jgi:hypothetical protein